MTATFQVKRSELNERFLNKLKELFGDADELNVVVSDEESIDETEYLMRDPKDYARLLESIAQLRRGETVSIDLDSFK